MQEEILRHKPCRYPVSGFGFCQIAPTSYTLARMKPKEGNFMALDVMIRRKVKPGRQAKELVPLKRSCSIG